MRRRQGPTVAEAETVDPERKAAAVARLRAWVEASGRTLPGDAMLYEAARSYPEETRLLDRDDRDELVEYARWLGADPDMTRPHREQLGAASRLVIAEGHALGRGELAERLAAFDRLTEVERSDLLARADARRQRSELEIRA